MLLQATPYTLPLLSLALLSGILAVLIWPQRSTSGGGAAFLAILAITDWSLGYAWELACTGLRLKLFWAGVQYLGIVTLPAALLCYVLYYTGRGHWVTRRNVLALSIEPLLTLAVFVTNSRTHWLYRSVRLQSMHDMLWLVPDHGLYYWLHTAYSYLLLALASWLVVALFVRTYHFYRSRATFLLLAVAAPWLCNVCYLLGCLPPRLLDPTPFGFAVSGLIVAMSLLRSGGLDLLPVVRVAVMENIADGVLVLDMQNRVVHMNRTLHDLRGADAARYVGQPVQQVWNDWPELLQRLRGADQGAGDVHWDGDGVPRVFEARISLMQDWRGQAISRVVVLRDVTARRRAEQDVQRRAEELAALQAITLDMTALRDLPGVLRTILQHAARLLNADAGELYLSDPVRQELRCEVNYYTKLNFGGRTLRFGQGAAGRVAQSGQPLIIDDYDHWPHRVAMSSEEQAYASAMISVPLLWQGTVMGVINLLNGPKGARFVPENIDLLSRFASQAAIAVANARLYDEAQRRLREQDLLHHVRESVVGSQNLDTTLQLILEAAIQAIPLGHKGSIHLWDEASQLLTARATVGFGPDTLLSSRFRVGEGYTGWVFEHQEPALIANVGSDPRSKILSPNDRLPDRSAICAPLVVKGRAIGTLTLDNQQRESAFEEQDLRLLTDFAAQAAIAIENTRLYDAAQRELAERRRVEESLRTSEGKFRTVVQMAKDGIVLIDEQMNVRLWNRGAERIFGYSAVEVEGKSLSALISDEQAAQHQRSILTLPERYPHGLEQPLELQGVRKDGSVVPFELSFAMWQSAGQTLYSAVIRDISERKHAEEEKDKLQVQLRQAQKMEAVGLLAGGIAHEFNNLLTVILGNAELGLEQLVPGQPAQHEIITMQKAAVRAATLTRQLLAFSRHQMLQAEAVDVNQVVGEFVALFGRVTDAQVTLKLDLASSLGPVLADAGALQQVLVNLTLNACDAMPPERGEGTLTIHTAQVVVDEAHCLGRVDARPGEFVCLSVADTGMGMDEETRQHVFEPFFTTKEVGKGTGLGLSVVHGIVAQHKGWIELYSQPGQGSRFDIYLALMSTPTSIPSMKESGV